LAFTPESCPIYINVRDRVTPLRQLVSWLERAGHERIILLDNDSSWPPLIEYLYASPHEVVWLGRNVGSRSLWRMGMVPSERFVFTDPDLIPSAECPLDAVLRLSEMLDRFPLFPKAGLGLVLDDLPPGGTLDWERSLVSPARALRGRRGGYASLIDTTFALYQPGHPFSYTAIRMGAPLQAVHQPWLPSDGLSDEDAYYLAHARGGEEGSSWRDTLNLTAPASQATV
jgi:hypothetical protein